MRVRMAIKGSAEFGNNEGKVASVAQTVSESSLPAFDMEP